MTQNTQCVKAKKKEKVLKEAILLVNQRFRDIENIVTEGTQRGSCYYA